MFCWRTGRTDGSPVKAFAAGLRRLRASAGLTYRQLAVDAHYSHTNLVRAASGRALPSWELARAYLVACGVSELGIPAWYEVWLAIDQLPPGYRVSTVVLDRIDALSAGVRV
ncbi:helix-turn-helix domain-containing protein [Kribbella endophytica]